MSWGIAFVAKSKGAAIHKIENTRKEHDHFPQEIADSLIAMVELVPTLLPGKALEITSNGHFDTYGGQGESKIRIMDTVD